MKRFMILLCVAAAVGLAAAAAQAAITIDTVAVGNPGNVADTTGYGSVGYNYNIGKYEVTAGQYTAFLNAVAKTDTYGLYNTDMSNTSYGSGITRASGVDGYTYTVADAFVNRPVNYVSWGDSARFANWLHNGQPTGAQGTSTTEDGAYFLNGAVTNAALMAVSRETDWKWAITSENEWYKAAYYDPNKAGGAGYWDYPTGVDQPNTPGRDMADASGNNANYYGTPYPIVPGTPGKYTTVVGEFQNSDSPYGTFDQGGNVWEWNEAILPSYYRGMRDGSSFYLSGTLLASYRYVSYNPLPESSNVGFRVASKAVVPEPGSLLLWGMLAGVGLLYRRRIHV
jgi:formylglycine-generating enzyme